MRFLRWQINANRTSRLRYWHFVQYIINVALETETRARLTGKTSADCVQRKRITVYSFLNRSKRRTRALTCTNSVEKVRQRVHTPLGTPMKCSWPHIIYLWLCRSNWAPNWVYALPTWSAVATNDSQDYLWLGEVLANFGHSIIQWWTLTEIRQNEWVHLSKNKMIYQTEAGRWSWHAPVVHASRRKFSDFELLRRKSNRNRGIVYHLHGLWQTNGNAVRSNVFVCENVNLAAAIAYKCRVHQTDSMVRVPDSVPTVCFCKRDLMANNDDCRLPNKTTNKTIEWKRRTRV